MKIELKEKNAYVHVGNGNLLCIGTRDDVHDASIEEINRMFYEAFMTNIYHGINHSKGMRLH